jgi:hypothetical protein
MYQAYHYDRSKVNDALYRTIAHNVTEQALSWLQQQKEQLEENKSIQRFNLTFTAIPRHTGKQAVTFPAGEEALPATAYLFIQGYTLDRLARVWWLLQLPATDKAVYVKAIEGLFDAADMNEQVALYGALPLLPWPEAWILRTAEGIRSNIGTVTDAIMLDNAYPAANLPEPAWNQLVMKAIFVEKPIHRIIGLDSRANRPLAAVLTDHAHERWAAGRKVNPLIWRLVSPFIDHTNFADIQRVWHSENNAEHEAAALACAAATYAPARQLLEKDPQLKEEIENKTITWDTVAARIA